MAQSRCVNHPTHLAGSLFLRPNSPSVSPYPYGTFISSKFTPRKCQSMVISASSPPSVVSGEPLTKSECKNELKDSIENSLSNCLSETHLDLVVPALKSKTRGKVRDIYDGGDYLVQTECFRQSACFDSLQGPGYVTGSTDTSLWTVYKKGIRNYCGNALPDGMVKNQKLPANILTPTTKAADHDVPITPEEIMKSRLMSESDYIQASNAAMSLFEYGQRIASEHGLILVDTKYEFGKGSDGTVLLIDEVHTSDSSRYWIAGSYEDCFQNGLEPENIDKEFLRLWFKDNCNPYEDEVLRNAPKELVSELSWRYILLYEMITKSKFELPSTKEAIHDRISRNVSNALSSLQ